MKSRNRYELELMRKSGQIASSALKKAIETIKAGVTELQVDQVVQNEIYRLGGALSYRSVPGYKYATCITVNEQVVHGIPTSRKFMTGDLVSIDLAVKYKGWHTDCAWSVLVGGSAGQPASTRVERGESISKSEEEEKKKFLQIGEQALWDGINQAIEGNCIGDISNAIQTRVESAVYSVVRSLVGHGIGKSLHEEPEIPGFGEAGVGLPLKKGMTLALEVIYTSGGSEVVLENDGWTFSTSDGSSGGLFEMTVIVGKKEAEILTDWRYTN